MKKKYKDRIISFLLCASCAVQLTGGAAHSGSFNYGEDHISAVRAAAAAEKTADVKNTSSAGPEENKKKLHIIFTAGLNGRLNTADTAEGRTLEGGLSRAAAAISEIRDSSEDQTVLIDGGDMIGNTVTSMIHEDSSMTQPIYKAAADIGYDAFVPGEEDLRYGKDYFDSQMENSGLADKTVIANISGDEEVRDYSSTITIKKNVISEKGENISVKVGIIGETECNFSGSGFKFDDTVRDAEEKAASLKADGCDIVICVLHDRGMNNAEKIAALKNIDICLCGHSCSTENISESPDVTPSTRKNTSAPVTGTSVKAAGIRTGSEVSGASETAATSSSPASNAASAEPDNASVRTITSPAATQEKPDITAVPDTSETPFSTGMQDISPSPSSTDVPDTEGKIVNVDKYGRSIADISVLPDDDGKPVSVSTDIIDTSAYEPDSHIENDYISDSELDEESQLSMISAETDSLTDINNYFGYIKDNGAIQLINEMNAGFGINIEAASDSKEIKDLPVVAGAAYSENGSKDPGDYISLSGEITRADLYDLVNTGKGLYVYEITGKQLKDLVEWSAGVYAGPDDIKAEVPSSSAVFGEDLYEITDSERLDDLMIFDGIEYTIDTSEKAYYSETGALTGSKGRVTSLTRNGVKISEKDKFIFVSEKLPELGIFNDITSSEITHITAAQYRAYINKYIENAGKIGKIAVYPDNNWKIKLSPDTRYILRSSPASASRARDTGCLSFLYKEDGYYVYELLVNDRFNDDSDEYGPAVFLAADNDETAVKTVNVYVQASDASGINELKMLPGKYRKNSLLWKNAESIKNNSFKCDEKRIYSVMAEDKNGNRTVKYADISNVDKDILSAPEINTYTNVSEKMTGSADPEAAICIETGDHIYKTSADASGNFSYALEPQNAGTVLYVYSEDKKGNVSSRTVVNVERGGPNRPELTSVKSNSKNVSGKLNDTAVYPFLTVNDTDVYIIKGDALTFLKSSSLWKDSLNVSEVDSVQEDSGNFTVALPQTLAGDTEVKLYTVDIQGRTSLPYTAKVSSEKPAKPSFKKSTVTNKSKKIVLFDAEQCTVVVKVNKKNYKDTSGTYVSKKGAYRYSVKVPRTDSGVSVSAYAKNEKGNSSTVTAKKTETVPDTPLVNSVQAGSTKVSGKVDICGSGKSKDTLSNTKTKVFVTIKGKKHKAKVSSSGSFSVRVKNIKKGSKVKVKAKNKNGNSLKAVVRAS